MTYIKDLTGLGLTNQFGITGADLGIPRYDPDRKQVAVLFGDTFSEPALKGDWRAPVALMYNAAGDPLGTAALGHDGAPVTDTAGYAHQLWDYQHNNGTFSTVLPTDFIRIGNMWWVHCMVMDQGGLAGGAVWTEWQFSKDLVHWDWFQKTEPAPLEQTMLTFDQVGEWVYIFGTRGLARDGHVRLWRCPAVWFPSYQTNWEAWNGRDWVRDGSAAMPVLTSTYGELCFRNTSKGLVLSYFDAGQYQVAARLGDQVETLHRQPQTVVAEGLDYPQLYGGYLWPTDDPVKDSRFAISQWRTVDDSVYKVGLHAAKLAPKRRTWWGSRPGLVV